MHSPFKVPTIESIKEQCAPEQVLSYFDITITANNLCSCPFHEDDTPSMQVNADYVYCHSCQQAWDVIALAKALLEQTTNKNWTTGRVLDWLFGVDLPKQVREYSKGNGYQGAVPMQLIEYWHSQLTECLYEQLYIERGILPDTINDYMLGWRPDYAAWVIPFFNVKGEVDIVQFRHTNPDMPKYTGLTGHNRGSVMNAKLLEQEIPYLVVFFGAFDPILAQQDGVYAVGTSGATAFASKEKERVQELFQKQKNVFVVPDKTENELPAAHRFAEWIGAEVKTFPDSFPEDTDYISYRKTHDAYGFLDDVLGIQPIFTAKPDMVQDIVSFIIRGDKYGLVKHHLLDKGRGLCVRDVALTLARQTNIPNIKYENWSQAKRVFYSVKSADDFYMAIDKCHNLLTGW